MQVSANSVNLIRGGNVIKQGDETPLTFQLNNDLGTLVNLTGATVTARMANSRIVVLEKEATVNEDNTITFNISSDDTTGHGQMRLEFVVTHEDGEMEIFPAQGYQEILITPSLGEIDAGEVSVITIEQFEKRVNESVTQANEAAEYATEQGDYAKSEADRLEGTDVSQLDRKIEDGLNSLSQEVAQNFEQSMLNKQLLKSKYDGMVGEKNKHIIIRKIDNDNYDIHTHYHQLKYIGYRFSRNDSYFDVPALVNGRPFSYYSSQEIELSNQKDSGLTNENLIYEGTWLDSANRKYSDTAGDYVEYKFYGSRIMFSTYALSNGGIASITIDGKAERCDAIPLTNGQALVDTYSATAIGKNIDVANNLDEGWHTIRVTVTGNKNPSSTGNRVYLTIFRTWQSIYAEQQSIDYLHIRGTGNIFKGPARIIEPVLQVGGAFIGSYHGYTQPKNANEYDLIADGKKVIMNTGDYIVCREVQFNQVLEYAKPNGNIFGEGILIYSINAERLGVLFDFNFTENTSTTRFFPVMAGVRADHYLDSEHMRKYKLQGNGQEIEISHNPFDVLLTRDLTETVYLMVINDVVNSLIINTPKKHFIADLASGDAKPYYNANKDTFKVGDSFKMDVDHYIGHCYKPSNLI